MLEQHVRRDDGGCEGCSAAFGEATAYPCPTRALASKALSLQLRWRAAMGGGWVRDRDSLDPVPFPKPGEVIPARPVRHVSDGGPHL